MGRSYGNGSVPGDIVFLMAPLVLIVGLPGTIAPVRWVAAMRSEHI